MKRIWLGLLGFLSLGTAAACYSPDLSGVHYICDENNPYCPDGLTCIAGTCAKPGETPMNGDLGSNPDLTTPANPDAAMPMPMPAAGCQSGLGFVLGGDVFACPGKFSVVRGASIPHADQLCASGYALCSQPGGADLAKCKTLSGFFGATQSARRDKNVYDPSRFVCELPKNGGDVHLYTGCGRSAQAPTYDISNACAGFTQVVECTFGGAWGCLGNTELKDADNTVATDGVLCCNL